MAIAQTLREKLLKIQALSKSGTGGEATAADAALKTMLEKHGMTMADLESLSEVLADFDFLPSGDLERRLLMQVIYSVVGFTRTTYKRPKTGQVGVNCTRTEMAEIAVRFEVLRVDFVKQFDFFYDAYCHKHELFPPQDKRTAADQREGTPEEIERLRRLMGGIDKAAMHKQIGGKR